MIDILSIIMGIILSVCNSANYAGRPQAIVQNEIEQRVLREIESRAIVRFYSLEQRDNFRNVVRNRSRMSEPEMRDALRNIFNDLG